MYVVCNHTPGPSVLGAPDPRRTDRFRVKCQHPNSQPPPTANNVQNCALSPTTSSQWYDVHTQMRIKQHITEITYNINRMCIRHHTNCSVESWWNEV